MENGDSRTVMIGTSRPMTLGQVSKWKSTSKCGGRSIFVKGRDMADKAAARAEMGKALMVIKNVCTYLSNKSQLDDHTIHLFSVPIVGRRGSLSSSFLAI
ncbi:predicted protein [Arabidopsis lyrata subsp. lyrata]|uniref:Predicted protein n=1 Tax=Arabidopsis lyrata subsp. lyrata TaxID=81972 RepID=D7LFC6_ARALL|nr:predicted protein [Arabidopsis lyrata subsp. lyrata]